MITFSDLTPNDLILVLAIAVILLGATVHWLWRENEAQNAAVLQRMALHFAILDHVQDTPVADPLGLTWYYLDLRDRVGMHDHARAILRGEDPKLLYHPDIQAIWP